MMNEVLREFLDQVVIFYLDDILIYSFFQEEHDIVVAKDLHKCKRRD